MTVYFDVRSGPVLNRVGRTNVQVIADVDRDLGLSERGRRDLMAIGSKLRFPPLRIILVTLRHGSRDKLTEVLPSGGAGMLALVDGPHEAAEPGRTRERPNRICEA